MTSRISLTMIVKNEAAHLTTCLQSVRDLVDEIIVVDTGSSDDTKEIAHQQGARVFDFPWCDSFAAARNEALRHATGDWILWMDGDEYLDDTNRGKLRDLLAALNGDNAAFSLKCLCLPDQAGGSGTVVDHVRLFRNHPAIRWDYRVHEQILPAIHRAGHPVRFTDITLAHTGYQNPTLRRTKLERNLRLLHLDYAERPNDPYTLFCLGWSYVDLGRYADAIPLLQKSLQHSHPSDSITPKLYVLLTQCHRAMRQHADAWAACQAGHVRYPDNAELLFLKGTLCREHGDRAGARQCWTQLLPAQDSRFLTVAALNDGVFNSVDAGLHGPLAHHQLATLCREEGNDAEAETHWHSALVDASTFTPARLGLAELYLRQSRWSELELMLAELECQPPFAIEAAILRARGQLARKEFAAARQLLDDVTRQAPLALSAWVILSHVLLQSGEESAAEPVLRKILELDPGQPESWRNLAVLYRKTRPLRDALTAVQSGLAHCPHDAGLHLFRGLWLGEAGDALNAETHLLRVLELSGGNGFGCDYAAAARRQLSRLYESQGRLREAETQQRALMIAGEDKGAA